MSAGPDLALALEYRWKRMNEGNAKLHRGRAQHDAHGQMIEAAFDPKVFEQAQQEVMGAASDGGGGAGLADVEARAAL